MHIAEQTGTRASERARWLAVAALVATGFAASAATWRDILEIAALDEEASHVLLVPFVVAWLVFARREALRGVPLRPSWLGPCWIAVGGVLSWVGEQNALQAAWHAGAVAVLVGSFWTLTGTALARRLLPALFVLPFLIPVPGMIRQEIAIPLQTAVAAITETALHGLGFAVSRSGNVLRYNGVTIAVAEACNGMRLVFSLALAAYALAFAAPYRTGIRVAILIASPVWAVVCNVLRLMPSVWLYGNYPERVGDAFHDVSAWGMLVLGFLLLLGVLRALAAAGVPLERET